MHYFMTNHGLEELRLAFSISKFWIVSKKSLAIRNIHLSRLWTDRIRHFWIICITRLGWKIVTSDKSSICWHRNCERPDPESRGRKNFSMVSTHFRTEFKSLNWRSSLTTASRLWNQC
jgi:hypothetical protein